MQEKLRDENFMKYIDRFDIVCLTETHIQHGQIDMETTFKSYCGFMAEALNLTSTYGRLSGGVLMLIRDNLKHLFKPITIEVNNCVALKLDKKWLGLNSNIILIGCYLPPQESQFWNNSEHGFGMELLDKCLLDIFDACGPFEYLLMGDLNARTAKRNMVNIDIQDSEEIRHTAGWSDFERNSRDGKCNTFGEQLLEFCSINDSVIINGLCKYNFDGGFTCIRPQGSSVVDYFVASTGCLEQLKIKTMKIHNEIYSDHLPIVMTIHMNLNDFSNSKEAPCKSNIMKLRWDQSKAGIFKSRLYSTKSTKKVEEACKLVTKNVDEALNIFNNCLKEAGATMIKRKSKNKSNKLYMKKDTKQWKDNEYFEQKHETENILCDYQNTGEQCDRLLYINSRKDFNKMRNMKRDNYEKERSDALIANLCNSQFFWRDIKSIVGVSTNAISSKISLSEWKDHFSKVFSEPYSSDDLKTPKHECDHNHVTYNHELDTMITETEVRSAIRRLNNGKASGIDEIVSEMIKEGEDIVINFLTRLFNEIFTKGIFPTEWSKAIVVPIHKKGNKDVPNNYRGISLINSTCKTYTSILNTRLYTWLETNNAICPQQAGFRQKFSTTDHIFTLYSVIERCMSKQGQKCYVAFVDLTKAFDKVRHESLLSTLKEHGIHGRFLGAIRSMYTSLQACVRDANGNVSELFPCPTGVRQGCILSPTLFSMLINGLAETVNLNGKHGIQLLPGLMELLILLFADDIALLSLTPIGLQHQLNILKTCCDRLHLTVNENKSKIMIFRKGGRLNRHEKWTFGGRALEIVNEYCYLGFVFTTKLSIRKGVHHMVLKAKKALNFLSKLIHNCKYITRDCYFRIFESKILPILIYGSEVWGTMKLDSIETIHMMACKRYLGLPKNTPNRMIYGELGRYPLYITTYIRCVKFWLRILKLQDTRLTKQAYLMQLSMTENNKQCWASSIKNILAQSGFYHVWICQGVGDVNLFLDQLKTRLIDMFIQDWSGTLDSRERYHEYRLFKSLLTPEKYITFINVRSKRISFTMARTNTLPINANLYRFSKNTEDRYCFMCNMQLEDEYHILLVCPLYKDIRQKFLGQLLDKPLSYLLGGLNTKVTYKVAAFILHSLKLRKKQIAIKST